MNKPGWDATRDIQEVDFKHTPVIYVSSYMASRCICISKRYDVGTWLSRSLPSNTIKPAVTLKWTGSAHKEEDLKLLLSNKCSAKQSCCWTLRVMCSPQPLLGNMLCQEPSEPKNSRVRAAVAASYTFQERKVRKLNTPAAFHNHLHPAKQNKQKLRCNNHGYLFLLLKLAVS